MIEQDMTLSTLLAVAGGLLQVLSVFIVAYPEHCQNESNKKIHPIIYKMILPLNIIAQALAGLCNTAAALFGPVSCVVPIAIASQLVWNIIVFDCLAKIENFDKSARVGAVIIALGAFMIPIVGPKPQNQNVLDLLEATSAVLWTFVLLAVMFISLYVNTYYVSTKKVGGNIAFVSLLAARVSSAVLCTSCSSSFASLTGFGLVMSFSLFVLFTYVMGHSTFFQAHVNQQAFVPAVACTTQIVNAMTGLIIWNDTLTIQSWSGYSAMMVQFLLGVYLTINIDVIQDASDPEYPFRPSICIRKVMNSLKKKKHVHFSDDFDPRHDAEATLDKHNPNNDSPPYNEEVSNLVPRDSQNVSYDSTLIEV
jgi:hypothetical protein